MPFLRNVDEVVEDSMDEVIDVIVDQAVGLVVEDAVDDEKTQNTQKIH